MSASAVPYGVSAEIDAEAAKEEIIAEYVGEALAKADKKTLHKIIGDRRNVAEVLLDLVNKLIDLFRKDNVQLSMMGDTFLKK